MEERKITDQQIKELLNKVQKIQQSVSNDTEFSLEDFKNVNELLTIANRILEKYIK